MMTENLKRSSTGIAAALGLALAATPLWAQQPQEAGSEAAKNEAEKVGMRDVEEVTGSSVLKGTSATDSVLYMIVGPAGNLLALAAPLPAPSGSAEGSAAQAAPSGNENTGAASKAGEPAEEGFMATQAQPATPNMWDPVAVESAIRQLELGTRAAAGEVAEN